MGIELPLYILSVMGRLLTHFLADMRTLDKRQQWSEQSGRCEGDQAHAKKGSGSQDGIANDSMARVMLTSV